MAKNAQNELKFGQDMYFYEFYQIPKDTWKIFKIGRLRREIIPFFSTENVSGPSKMLRMG